MRPTPARQLEVRVRTQQHIPLLLLLLLLLPLLFPPPRHAQTCLSGPPVRIHAPLADGRHVAVIACRTHLAVLQLLVRGAPFDGYDCGALRGWRWVVVRGGWCLRDAGHQGGWAGGGRLGGLRLVGGVGFRGDEAGVDVFVV